MRNSFRAKLMLSYLLLLLVMSGAIYGYLNYSLENSIVGSLRENLASQARLAALMAEQQLHYPGHDIPQLATSIGKVLTARVTIINASGAVIGDSEVSSSLLGGLENHLDRPEVRDALQRGTGTAIRYSVTLKTDMLYVAVLLNNNSASNSRPFGVVRLALPLAALENAKTGMHITLGISLLAAFLLSLLFSYFLSRLTLRPLQQVAAIATEIGQGNFQRRLPMGWPDELGDLAKIMNSMAGRLEEQLTSLLSERNRLDAILSGMGEGLMVTDEKGAITLVNPAFCHLFGIQSDIVGKPLLHISRHPALHTAYKLVSTSRRELQEQISIQAKGEKIISTHWVPLLQENRLQGIVAVFHDISEQKQLEKIRKDFVANVSHELRTPITVIKGYAEELSSDLLQKEPERAVRFARVINNHAERLSALINDLLSLSELESGSFALQLQAVPLATVIRNVCSLLEPKAELKAITLKLPPAAGLPDVMADQGRLEQVLINLLDNALKYTPKGGSITINVLEEGSFLRVTIHDTGPGIPPDSIPRLFERFYRVDDGRSRDEGGTGLGLSIVKHIVQLHGGTVAVECRPGQGTTFSFTIRKAAG